MSIADRLLKHESFIADYYTSVSILFMDLVGFTDLSSKVKPKQLVYILDTIFSRADEIIDRMGLEKIKTIGDGYLAVANLTSEVDQHQIVTAKAALDILSHLSTCTFDLPEELQDEEWMQHIPPMQVRIGIHTGDVVAGIIGKNKFVFDLWGDAVNIASRMESTSQPGKIHVSDTFASHIIHDSEFQLIPRESIEIKGKGMMNTFWLENQK
jgi:class 3 adenylate cyclase